MSSVEKKQIIENAPFAVTAGLVMGGPAGAVMAGLATAGMAAMQESVDQKRRQAEWDRNHPDPIKKQKELEALQKKLNDKYECCRRVQEMMHIDSPDIEKPCLNSKRFRVDPDHYLDTYRKETREYEDIMNEHGKHFLEGGFKYGVNRVEFKDNVLLNDNTRSTKHNNPEHRPHVFVKIEFADKTAIPIGNGILYKIDDFERKLEKDLSNPNIYMYHISGRAYCGIHNDKISFMYTLDGGKNYVIGVEKI